MCARARPLSVWKLVVPALGLAGALGGVAASGCASPAGPGTGSDKVVSSGLAGLEDEAPTPSGDDEIERMIAESASRLERYFADEPEDRAPGTGEGEQAAPDNDADGFSSLAALDESPTIEAAPAPIERLVDTPSVSAAGTDAAGARTTPEARRTPAVADPAEVALADAYGIRPPPPRAQVRGGDGIDFLVALGAPPKASRADMPAGEPGTRGELADRLADSLRALVEDSSDPDEAYRAAAALAGLEAIEPGAIDRISGTSSLTPEQLEVIRAAGEMARALGNPEERLDADRASDLMGRLSRRLAAARGLRVTTATLCTRVQGFGRYEEFGSNVFLAGQAQPVIVYVEVDGFESEAIPGGASGTLSEVRLSQRLEMYHAADGLNTWNRAAETDRTVSRNELRDYYLINQVVLPSNLSVGRYVLKVVMRDLNSERGAVDEALIPIEIVSDPSIAFPNNARVSAQP